MMTKETAMNTIERNQERMNAFALAIGMFWILCGSLPSSVFANETHGARLSKEDQIRFPVSSWVLNVKESPYNAKGDGKTDDTLAIQRALNDLMGSHRVLYFPSGTYLISKTLQWTNRKADGTNAWGYNWLQGQGTDCTKIVLKDSTFRDPTKPQSMMWCGGFGSADWFHNHIENIAFDIGRDNPGAIGLQFYSNNYGALRHVRITDRDGTGVIGLHLGYADMNGPLLVKHCEITGFGIGIQSGFAVNGQVIEHVTLEGQQEVGISNAGQSLKIRSMRSQNRVPAVMAYGTTVLVDATLEGIEGANSLPAVVNYNGGRLYVRDLEAPGYRRAIASVESPDSVQAFQMGADQQPHTIGPRIEEYASTQATVMGNDPWKSLRLPVRETPELEWESPEAWANAVDFGADPTGSRDSSEAIQRAIDSGAKTVFLPGFMAITKTVIVRSRVERIIGTGGWLDYTSQAKPTLRIEDGAAPIVFLEHLSSVHGGIEVDTARPIVFKSMGIHRLSFTAKTQGSEVYMEDVTTLDLQLNRQRMWARQLNIENEGTHLTNRNGDAWILGYKTERGGTLARTEQGGRTEILGGFSYTTTAGKLAPMFVTRDASTFAYFGEVCFNGDPYEVLIEHERAGRTERIRRGEGDTLPYVAP
jgi:hypothetical protein